MRAAHQGELGQGAAHGVAHVLDLVVPHVLRGMAVKELKHGLSKVQCASRTSSHVECQVRAAVKAKPHLFDGEMYYFDGVERGREVNSLSNLVNRGGE